MLIFNKRENEYIKDKYYHEITEDDGYNKRYYGIIYMDETEGEYVFDQSDVEDCAYEYTRSTILELADFMKSLENLKEKK